MRFLSPMLDAVFPPRETEVLVRSFSDDSLIRELAPVLRGEYGLPVISLFPYSLESVQACILEAKFHGNMRASQLLGSALHEFLREYASEFAPWHPLFPILVPLPLSAEREKERGYNQTERIAQIALNELPNIGVDASILYRTRETVPQTSLSGSARRENLTNAFATHVPCNLERTYIIFDDVITTGNTLRAAHQALLLAGARHSIPLTLAY